MQVKASYGFSGSALNAPEKQLRSDVPITEAPYRQPRLRLQRCKGPLKIPGIYKNENNSTTLQLQFSGQQRHQSVRSVRHRADRRLPLRRLLVVQRPCDRPADRRSRSRQHDSRRSASARRRHAVAAVLPGGESVRATRATITTPSTSQPTREPASSPHPAQLQRPAGRWRRRTWRWRWRRQHQHQEQCRPGRTKDADCSVRAPTST